MPPVCECVRAGWGVGYGSGCVRACVVLVLSVHL